MTSSARMKSFMEPRKTNLRSIELIKSIKGLCLRPYLQSARSASSYKLDSHPIAFCSSCYANIFIFFLERERGKESKGGRGREWAQRGFQGKRQLCYWISTAWHNFWLGDYIVSNQGFWKQAWHACELSAFFPFFRTSRKKKKRGGGTMNPASEECLTHNCPPCLFIPSYPSTHKHSN